MGRAPDAHEADMDDTTTVADAPDSSSTSTPSSAPSSSPSAEPTVTTDRPSIGDALSVFNEAAKAQGRKTRGRITPTGEPSPMESPTTQAEGTTDLAPAPKGPIPFDVHDTALKNARQKERQAVEQEFRTTVGDPQVAREATKWFQRAAQDRVGFLRDVINEALSDPTLGPQVLSLAGKTLGGNRQGGPQTSPEMPGPDFHDGNGNEFYSAKRMPALIEQIKADILGQVQPELDESRTEREQRHASEQQAESQRQAVSQIQSHIAEARKLPHFEQFKDQISAAARAMPLTSGHPAEEAIVLQRAYWQVVGPELSKLEQNRVLKDLKDRAHASSLNPASTGAPSGIPKNVRAKDGGTFGNALKWAQAQTSGR